MRRLAALLLLLLLPACYQVGTEVVPAARAVRVAGLTDGLYRRADGTEVMVRWNAHESRYDIGVNGGRARAEPVTDRLFLVDYVDKFHLALLVSADAEGIAVHLPAAASEARLLADYRVARKAGPVDGLAGPADAVRACLLAMASVDDLAVAERLTRVR
ncbi:MAG: hypothetical protein HY985_09285 [Magnetospirillum sp.]|nr:hypothetical protein [Magnetospirillum sp.]